MRPFWNAGFQPALFPTKTDKIRAGWKPAFQGSFRPTLYSANSTLTGTGSEGLFQPRASRWIR